MIFQKLRNMFLALNLVTTTIMMMVAFATIYVITATDIRRNIENDLMRISGADRAPAVAEMPPPRPGTTPAVPPPEIDLRPPRSISFSLLLDDQGAVVGATSVFEADESLYEEAAAAAFAETERFAQARLEGTQWSFIRVITPDGTRAVFIDVSAQQAILTNLVYTFLIVAGGMLVIIFLISKAFADRAIKPIRDAFEKQKEFVADASHELRTPVAVISSNVDVLLANPDDRIADHRKWLDYIKQESARMGKLTNDLLYLATVDHSDETLNHVPVDLSQMVESIVLSMEAVFFESGLTLSHDIGPGLMTSGDAARLERVLVVLLENAVRYSDDRGTVTVRMSRSHNTIVLEVSNPNEGIGPEHLDRIFDRFYRADAARSREQDSYGLGLAIAREIVRQHRGSISAHNEEDRRTTFRVELPLLG